MKKRILLIFILISLSSLLTACFDSIEIDEKAYVIAIGLDKGQNNYLKMTLQIAIPSKISSGEGGGSGGEGSSTSITTVETPTLYAGLNMANTYISKKLDFSHCKVMVFSKELAQEGIHKYIHAVVRGREFRGSMYVAVSRDLAEEYIRNVVPTIEINPTKHYEMNFESFKYTGFTGDTTLLNFYLLSECSCRQTYATLVGVNKYEKSSDFSLEDSTYKSKGRELPLEGDFLAGNIPKAYDVKSEIMGIAAFDGGKMVAEFDGEESLYHSILYGTYNHSYFSIPDPKKPDNFVIINMKQSRMPTHSVKMINDEPLCSAKVQLEADIISIQSGFNYESPENIDLLEKEAERIIKEGILRFLKKTTPIHADLCGFGRALKEKYLLWDDWAEVHWLEKYADAKFQIEVDFRIRRTGLMLRSAPANGSEGDVMN